MVLVVGLAALACAGACAARAGRPDYPLGPHDGDDDPAAGRGVDDEPAPAEAAAPATTPRCTEVPAAERRASGEIGRDELLAVLDAGPPAFLAGLRVEAVLDGRRFLGWRLLSFYPCDARFDYVDLVAGDIILRVNGERLERPEMLQKVWDGLRDAPRLVVEIDRAGEARTLEWAISE
jgi:type II secretory pathway component PulC